MNFLIKKKGRLLALLMASILVIGTVMPAYAQGSEDSSEALAGELEENNEEDIPVLLMGDAVSKIKYSAFMQGDGWLDPVPADGIAGLTGQSKRLEAFRLEVDGATESSGVEYRAYVNEEGWLDWVQNGETAGTEDESRALEALEIQLTGTMKEQYDIYYRVHVQDLGWLGWAANGETAGTENLGLRAEAVQIRLVEKGTDAPDDTTASSRSMPGVTYCTHVQTYGWQGWVSDGASAGTTGESKRIEALMIKLSGDSNLSGSIEYRTHVQNYGWQGWSADGAVNGITGQSKRAEAVEIRLTGELEKVCDVYYRVHVQNVGWLDWAKNGQTAGSTGLSKRVEAIEIVLVRKGEEAPGSTERACVSKPGVTYRTHVQTYGWQGWVSDGESAGTTGESKRIEALAIQLTGDTNLSGSIEYRTHMQTYGWQGWSADGSANGVTGQSKRAEAVQIRLTGELAKLCDVYYRVHVQGYGWLGWAKNGETAGTSGLGLRVEAIEIRIGVKSAGSPVTLGAAPSHSYTGPGYYTIGKTRYYYYANGLRRSGTGWTRSGGKRYYMIDGKYVTGWQYIGNYKYYFNSDGSLCQNVDNIIGVQSSYVIQVNKQANCVTIYASDGANGYIIPVKAMLCSTGDDTPLGTFYTPAKYRWKAMFNGTYAQYATRLTAGQGFLFHSITYETTDNHTMIAYGYNGLGTVRSAGCIRLLCGEAYWIYSRCSLGTKVIVYNSETPGPFDRPVVEKIPETQTWDPTDPNL